MSTNARVELEKAVEARIEDGPDPSLTVNSVKSVLADRLDVTEATADNYIRQHCKISRIDGDRHIIAMKDETDTTRSTISTTNEQTDATPEKTGPDADHAEELREVQQPVGARTGDDFEGLAILADNGHPLIPDVKHSYLRREQAGNTTDIENINDFLADPDFSVLLIGETGTGKDFSILYICARTNRPVRRVNFGAGTTFEDLVGLYAPKPDADDELVEQVREMTEAHDDLSMDDAISLVTGAKSHFEYQLGVLAESAVNGGVFVADEINAAGGEATMPLHGVTESEGSRYLHLKPSAKVLTDLPVSDAEVQDVAAEHGIDPEDDYSKAAHLARVEKWDDDKHYGDYIHPEFKFVGTMNPPTYAGTKPLNDAFRTRFWPVTMDYLSQKAEKQLLFEATPLDPDDEDDQRAVEKMTKIAANLRQSYKDMDIVTPISHREMIKVGKLSQRMGPKGAMKYVLGNIAQDEDKSAISDTIEMEKF